MSRWSRNLSHWETLFAGGHCTPEEFREAARQLGADESYIISMVGPEPEEIEEQETEIGAAA